MRERPAEPPSTLNPRAFRSRPPAPAADSRVKILGAPLNTILSSPFLAVEIGCGVGLHPIQYSQVFPARAMVAIERTSDKFSRFARRMQSHSELQSRLCAVNADAFHFLDSAFPDRSIDEVWILYPNPEPKKASRRWFYTPFTGRLLQLLKPGGRIFLATNIESYARDCLSHAREFGLRIVSSREASISTHPEFQPRTHFEKKYFERGDTLFDLEFQIESSHI